MCFSMTNAEEQQVKEWSDLLSLGLLVLQGCSATLGHLRYEVVMQGGEVRNDAGLALQQQLRA